MILFYNNNRQGLRCLSVSELSESESKNGTINVSMQLSTDPQNYSFHAMVLNF